MTEPVTTQEALTAAAVAIHDADCPDRTCSDAALGHSYKLAGAALEAAGPLIRAGERQRLADRAQMTAEVKAELDDAFQFAKPDGSRHGYVTREWVEALIATQAASAAAAAIGAQAGADLVRQILVAVCQRDRISLDGDAEPGTPARNYELALRLGIGRVFGLPEDARARTADIASRAEEIHAEHHYGVIVPSLDSCPEHDRADYEAMVQS